MNSQAMDDFIDDCFIEQDPICNIYRDDSLWLDCYASKLTTKITPQPQEE